MDDKRKRNIAIGGAAAALVALLAFFATRSIGGTNWASYEAAHVNDAVITEQEVLQEVTQFREATGLDEDEAWSGWLAQQYKTPESYRRDTIETLVHREVVRQAAEQEEVEVSSDEVQETIASNKEQYQDNVATGDGEEAWQNALRLNGYNDETYAAHIRNELLEDKLATKIGWGATYGTWIDDFTASCDIEIAPMPDGLPYA